LGGTFGPLLIVDSLAHRPFRVFAVDMDGDADLDLLTSYYEEQTVWFANDGAGNFGPQNTIAVPFGPYWSFHPADLDGDGDQDVITYSGIFPNHVLLWYAIDGGGVFSNPTTIDGTAITNYVLATDADDDGDVDIVTESSGIGVRLYANDGSGAFSPPQLLDAVIQITSIQSGDLNGDGHTDFIYASTLSDMIRRVLGGFSAPDTAGFTNGDPFVDLELADLDGDSDLDIVTGQQQNNHVIWMANDGTGVFGAANVISNEYPWPSRMFVSDVDNDGLPDVLCSSSIFDRAFWFKNLGTSTSIHGAAINEISAAPNPFHDRVTIRADHALLATDRLVITDTRGVLVRELRGNSSHELTAERDGLAAGVYVLRMQRAGILRSATHLVVY